MFDVWYIKDGRTQLRRYPDGSRAIGFAERNHPAVVVEDLDQGLDPWESQRYRIVSRHPESATCWIDSVISSRRRRNQAKKRYRQRKAVQSIARWKDP